MSSGAVSSGAKRAYVTYFDQRYLAKAIVMIRSLRLADPQSTHFCVCLDDMARRVIDSLAIPGVQTLSLAEIHAFEPRLAACADRPRWAFYATHKPVIPLYLMQSQPDLECVMHIDADTMFFSPMDDFLEEMDGASIGLSPHRFPPRLKHLEKYGTYNAGFVFWRNDGDGRACLEQYREDCLDWCWPDVLPDGRFMNQGYLNKWPATCNGVREIAHPGLNVAYWNIESHDLAKSGRITVDGRPLVFFHFSHLYYCPDGVWRTADMATERNWEFVVGELINPYLAEVEKAQAWLDQTWPGLAMVDLPVGWPSYLQVRPQPEKHDGVAPISPGEIQARLQSAVQLHQQGRIEEAEITYRAILAADPRNFEALQLLATAAAQRGRAGEAVDRFRQALALSPDNAGALANLGGVLVGLGRFAEAVEVLERGARAAPGAAFVLNNLGVALTRIGRSDEALAQLDVAIANTPQAAELHANRAATLAALGRYVEADAAATEALRLQARSPGALAARGFARNCMGRYADALTDLNAAIELNAADPDVWTNRAVSLIHLSRADEARDSAARALALVPDHPRALHQHGNALAAAGQADAALASFNRAISTSPRDAEMLVARGALLASRGKHKEALADYDAALRIDPRRASAWAHRAAACFELRCYADMLEACRRAQELEPAEPFVAGLKWLALHHLCDWNDLPSTLREVESRIRRGEPELLPFSALLLADPALQRQAIENWTSQNARRPDSIPAMPRGRRPLKVGYFSADFRNHPVMALMAGVFESHDRARIEPVAFGFGAPAKDGMRARAEAAFGGITDIGHLDDPAALKLAREVGLDIAIDLTGHTSGGRPDLFARRIAPVQISYLGFLGTMGIPAYDYLIADEICIPAKLRHHYTEKIIWMPDCYQPNDRKRPLPRPGLTRAECGLPDDAFVFCGFNNSYKNTPDVFARWMAILKAVPGAVLWLFADNEVVCKNLTDAAESAGVARERLVFADRVGQQKYIDQYALADLFLDTAPYNAHTTASDAMWSGLPVLTQIGDAFAGRAASLLKAVGMSELVAETPTAYIECGVALANDRPRLAELRQRLAENRDTCVLFDTMRFTRNLEAVFHALHARAEAGLPPEHMENVGA